MFESFLAVPLHFTVEFLGFLVCAGGAFLIVSRESLVPGPPSNRVIAALGLGAIAAGQVLHGGSFLPLDADKLLVGIYSVGLAFLAVSLADTIRPTPPTYYGGGVFIVGLAIKEPFALFPAGAAGVLALAAAAGAVRGGGRALWRLAIGAIFLGASEVFTALAPNIEFGVGEVSGYANLAHGMRALGFVFIGAWLWSGVRSSIRVRFVAAFAGLLLVVVLVLSSALTGVIANNVEEGQLESTSAQLEGVADDYRQEDLRQLTDASAVIAADERSIKWLRANNKKGLNRIAADYADPAERRRLDFVMFVTENDVAYAGTGPERGAKGKRTEFGNYVTPLAGSDVVTKVAEGRSTAANPVLVRNAIAVMAAVQVEPIRGGNPLGVVATGRFIDASEIEQLAETTSPALPSLIVERKVVASALPGTVAQRFKVSREIADQVGEGETVALSQAVSARSYFNAFAPLLNRNDVPVDDTILALSFPARVVSGVREEVTRILFLVAMGIAAVALGLAWLSGRLITRPIQRLTLAAGAVREGDLTARAEVSGEDEVGQLGETFNDMTAALLRNTNDLREAAIQEQELRSRIETIIQSMADGLVAVGPDHRILMFNPQAEELMGIEASEAVGKPVTEIIDARDTHGRKFPLPIYDLAEGSVDGIFIEREGADRVPVSVDSAILRGPDGEPAGGVAVLRDMTREREIERMKSEFLSNISHELRTPLTPIKGYAEILGHRDVPSDKTKQFAGGILESTARLERIVELLIDFSALEAGRLPPRTKAIDVGDLVEDLAEDARKRAKSHEIVVDVKARLPKVIGDERLLRRSLEEVIDNAVKFSPHGGTIRLEATGASSSNGRRTRTVQITVADEGIGIAREDLSKIFSDFHQLDGSATRTYGGLGLGLAFVQRIVAAHDGSIDVSSQPDKGTRLTISIPAATRSVSSG